MPVRFALPMPDNQATAPGLGLQPYVRSDAAEAPHYRLQSSLVEPTAIPSPFARGLAMAAGLRLAEAGTQPPQLAHFQTLALGIVLGHLQVQIVDVFDRASVGPRLADALKKADRSESRRMMGILRGANVVFGGTDPDALFWPSPRRFGGKAENEADAEWNALQAKVNKDPNAKSARELLWSWRKVLVDASAWSSSVAWMRGIDWMLEGVTADPGHLLQSASRTVGPLRLTCPNPELPGQTAVLHLYFPVLDATAAQDLLGAAMRGVEAAAAGSVAIQDDRGTTIRRVALPSPAGTAGALDLGAGVVGSREPDAKVFPVKANTLKLDAWFSTFAPLYNSISEATLQRWRKLPVLAPDPVRLVTLRLGALGTREKAQAVTYSSRALQVLFLDDRTGESRLPAPVELAPDPAAATFGAVLSVTAAGSSTEAIFVERAAGHDVGDLSMVGWLLWGVFLRTLKVEDDGRIYEGSDELTFDPRRPIGLHKPFEQAVAEAQEKGWALKLATLQRFVAAFPAPADAEASSHQRLFSLASRAWARRLLGGLEPRAQGEVQSPSASVQLWQGWKVVLPVDR